MLSEHKKKKRIIISLSLVHAEVFAELLQRWTTSILFWVMFHPCHWMTAAELWGPKHVPQHQVNQHLTIARPSRMLTFDFTFVVLHQLMEKCHQVLEQWRPLFIKLQTAEAKMYILYYYMAYGNRLTLSALWLSSAGAAPNATVRPCLSNALCHWMPSSNLIA